ncbi:MAG: hypothetical protein HC809_04160 [Gammaproteobacteria bacterium]|nr:hypothetical protein [Gammaproteobacteria bacterium]
MQALTADAQSRAESLRRAFDNDLDEFYVAPTTEQINAQPGTDYTLKLAAAVQEAKLAAIARVRTELEAIYSSAYWSARYYDRQLQALAAVRDEPTLVARPDPDNPGQMLPPRPATEVLEEDEERLLALQQEMSAMHGKFSCSGGL